VSVRLVSLLALPIERKFLVSRDYASLVSLDPVETRELFRCPVYTDLPAHLLVYCVSCMTVGNNWVWPAYVHVCMHVCMSERTSICMQLRKKHICNGMYKYVRMCFCIRKERNDFLIPDRLCWMSFDLEVLFSFQAYRSNYKSHFIQNRVCFHGPRGEHWNNAVGK
jgi:hypothetical protein